MSGKTFADFTAPPSSTWESYIIWTTIPLRTYGKYHGSPDGS
jgi:hypothetical protein